MRKKMINYEVMLVNLKWMEKYQLVIKSEKLILDLEVLLIKKLLY